jgi:hypothetical protein
MDVGTHQSQTFWGFDSEFLPTGLSGDPASVHSVQFSDGDSDHYFLESASELRAWLHNRHRTVKELFGFNMLCDLGAIKEWLPPKSVEVVQYKGKLIGKIHYGSCHIKAYDIQPLLNNFGLRRLEDVGDVVGVPKLPKPLFLGLRKWSTEAEHEAFRRYALTDAIITAKATRWLIEENGCDPRVHASAGSLASEYFSFPRRHKTHKKKILMPPIERAIAQNTNAGRNEFFVTGYTPHAYYNDVKSLYPLSIVATKTLLISGVVPCHQKDLSLDPDLNNPNFGWLEGFFYTENKMWGLPIQAIQVTYVIGYVMGLFHTFDLASAKAKPIWISKAYKPVFDKSRRKEHERFASLLTKRLEGDMNERESRFAKAVLNSTYGKLGQSHPEAPTTNYPAFSTILAHSHLIMSKLFDKCPTPILGMDTDSIFSETNMSGKHGELTDGDHTFPIIMEVKGKGELASFRAKTYMMREEGKPIRVYGRHAWHYFLEDYFRLWENPEFPFVTRIEIKHTLKTKTKQALKLPLGFWCEKPVKLTRQKVCELLQADKKRKRRSYDSYALFEQRKNQSSEPYVMDEILFDETFTYPPKSTERFPYLQINKFETKPVG